MSSFLYVPWDPCDLVAIPLGLKPSTSKMSTFLEVGKGKEEGKKRVLFREEVRLSEGVVRIREGFMSWEGCRVCKNFQGHTLKLKHCK